MTILAMVALATGCGTSAPVPTAPSPPEVTVAVTAPVCTQDASPPPRVYVAVDPPSSLYHGGTLGSQFLLCSDQTFALQYSSPRFLVFEYRGTYVEADGWVTFQWFYNQQVSAKWGPTLATLVGDLLSVRYDIVMSLDGFEDGVYVRTQ